MNYTIVKVGPAIEPITQDEARTQLRVDVGFDEDKITDLISMSRAHVEGFCNRFFTEQTVLIVFDAGFSGLSLKLPYPDLKTINSVKTVDSSGVETVIDDAEYTFNSDLERIYFTSAIGSGVSVLIEVVTGAPVEFEGAKIAMLMFMTDLYELRTESLVGVSIANNPAIVNQMFPFRVNMGV